MILAIVQARMGSSRLPGKVMLELSGIPILLHVVNRVSRAKRIDSVLVATTTGREDDAVDRLCRDNGIAVYRGSRDDVLARFIGGVEKVQSTSKRVEYVVRITADCPLIDPDVIDEVVKMAVDGGWDYVTNGNPPTFPDGLDVEVMTLDALNAVGREAVKSSDREHVTPYIRNSGKFKAANFFSSRDLSPLRWTLDTPDDYRFISEVYSALYPRDENFGTDDILELLKSRPELLNVNSNIRRNEGYTKSLLNDKVNEMNKGVELWKKAKKMIPGGNQLLSKRSEMFLPDHWPSYYSKAKGAEVWDLDGNRYIDMCIMGIGACPLGYADPDVNEIIQEAVKNGSMCTLNCAEEVYLADELMRLHPWADMARFARCGGESMAIAVRIARARTRRDKVAFCGYHGWQDWYLAANLADDSSLDGHLLPGLDPAGVPRGLIGTSVPFRYNHFEELERINDSTPGGLAAIVIEPVRDHDPAPGFLESVRELATKTGAVLIVDEVSSGFRLNTGGAHLLKGMEPDIAVFAKAMGNGYPIGAIIGRCDVMQAAQDTFISSTYWTERLGPAAALATIEKYKKYDVSQHLVETGRRVQDIWRRAASKAGIEIDVGGIAPLSHFSFNGDEDLGMQTLYSQLMLDRGYLAGKSFYSCYAHTKAHLDGYEVATMEAFEIISQARDRGQVTGLLMGPPAHKGFKRLT